MDGWTIVRTPGFIGVDEPDHVQVVVGEGFSFSLIDDERRSPSTSTTRVPGAGRRDVRAFHSAARDGR